MHTFRSNVKCSLLKLLFTFACLCEGTPLQPLKLDFFGIDFPSHPRSQFTFLTFRGQDNRTRGKAVISHERHPLPNWPTPATLRPPPPHLPLNPLQGKPLIGNSYRCGVFHLDGSGRLWPVNFDQSGVYGYCLFGVKKKGT